MICNLRNAISCTKRRSSKMGGGGNRAAWRIQILAQLSSHHSLALQQAARSRQIYAYIYIYPLLFSQINTSKTPTRSTAQRGSAEIIKNHFKNIKPHFKIIEIISNSSNNISKSFLSLLISKSPTDVSSESTSPPKPAPNAVIMV